MSGTTAPPREQALQLKTGDEFQWVGEGWSDDGPRSPNRATVQDISEDTDHEGEPATVIAFEGVQGGEADLYVYDDRDDVILYGSAEREERIVDIFHPPR
jgi:hypothetical protein